MSEQQDELLEKNLVALSCGIGRANEIRVYTFHSDDAANDFLESATGIDLVEVKTNCIPQGRDSDDFIVVITLIIRNSDEAGA